MFLFPADIADERRLFSAKLSTISLRSAGKIKKYPADIADERRLLTAKYNINKNAPAFMVLASPG